MTSLLTAEGLPAKRRRTGPGPRRVDRRGVLRSPAPRRASAALTRSSTPARQTTRAGTTAGLAPGAVAGSEGRPASPRRQLAAGRVPDHGDGGEVQGRLLEVEEIHGGRGVEQGARPTAAVVSHRAVLDVDDCMGRRALTRSSRSGFMRSRRYGSTRSRRGGARPSGTGRRRADGAARRTASVPRRTGCARPVSAVEPSPLQPPMAATPARPRNASTPTQGRHPSAGLGSLGRLGSPPHCEDGHRDQCPDLGCQRRRGVGAPSALGVSQDADARAAEEQPAERGGAEARHGEQHEAPRPHEHAHGEHARGDRRQQKENANVLDEAIAVPPEVEVHVTTDAKKRGSGESAQDQSHLRLRRRPAPRTFAAPRPTASPGGFGPGA